MKILLHICCGPCSIYPLQQLQDQEVTGFYSNPNIHPYTEWKQRRLTLEAYMASLKLPLILDREYGLIPFLRTVVFKEQARCSYCYEMRLRRTAELALAEGFEAFSTTLLVSPYQKHDLIRQTGENIAAELGIKFFYQDFRPGFRAAQEEARSLGMYMQKYCGCIYSEQERYDKNLKRKNKKIG